MLFFSYTNNSDLLLFILVNFTLTLLKPLLLFTSDYFMELASDHLDVFIINKCKWPLQYISIVVMLKDLLKKIQIYFLLFFFHIIVRLSYWLLLYHYGLKCVLLNLYVEDLTPRKSLNVITFGVRAFCKVIKVQWGFKGGALLQ